MYKVNEKKFKTINAKYLIDSITLCENVLQYIYIYIPANEAFSQTLPLT